jgi:hypothetical protein
MFKKSLLVVFIAIALFAVAGQVPTASAAGAGWAFCSQNSSDCAPILAAGVTGATSTVLPASGAALELPQIVPASPYGEVFTGNDRPE